MAVFVSLPMPKLTALIHANNGALALEQTLKNLRPCDEVLVIDHESKQDTAKIAEQHRATYKQAIVGVDNGAYAIDASNDWILCLQPGESLSHELRNSLEEWKKTDPGATAGYLVGIRDKDSPGKRPHELRLINRTCLNWKEATPGKVPNAPELKGDLLRRRNLKH